MRRWPFALLAFVGVALLALLASPIVLEVREGELEDLRRRIEPARNHVGSLQLALAREALNERRYLLSGDTTYLHEMEQLRKQQEAALTELRRLALPPAVAPALNNLESVLDSWYDTRQAALMDLSDAQRTQVTLRLASMYEASLAAADRLMAAVEKAAEEQRQDYESWQSTWWVASSALAFLTLVAVAALAWFGWYLHRLSGRLGRAVDARDDVLAMVSHDLRNPMDTVSTGCSVLREQLGDDEQVRMVRLMDTAVTRMDVMIEDLLDADMVARDELVLDRRIVEVAALLDEVAEATDLVATIEELEVRVEKPPNPAAVLADPDRLQRVLLNLVSNAFEATGRGGTITLGAEPHGRFVRFSVADTGEGIPEEKMESLFERTGPRGAKRSHGLGLAIVRAIVEAHGGEIRVASEVGKGTVFRFTIPSAERAQADPATSESMEHT